MNNLYDSMVEFFAFFNKFGFFFSALYLSVVPPTHLLESTVRMPTKCICKIVHGNNFNKCLHILTIFNFLSSTL